MENSNLTNAQLLLSQSSMNIDDISIELTWNEILYDGGLATWVPRLSFRWLTICVCLIGVLGNLLAVFTLLRPRLRTLSTCTYLTALCLSNIITLISVIVFEIDVLVEPNHLNCFVISISKALASTTFALSTWITVGFTVDRYIMICFPFVGEHRCTRRNTIYVIIICLLVTITYLIPQLFAQKCQPITQYPYTSTINRNVSTYSIYWVPGLSELGKSSIYRLIVMLLFDCFLIRIIPFLVIAQLNYRLIQTLAQTKRQALQLNPYEQKRRDLTYMLVIVISTYLVCVMPSIPFAAFFAYDPRGFVDISFHYRIFQHLDEFTKFLMILNSALQCYLYMFFGKRFRRELTSFLCCVCVKYLYLPIPKTFNHDDSERFIPHVRNSNDIFEYVLRGEWSVDQQRHSLNGIEFSFHYIKRPSHHLDSNTLLKRLFSFP